MKTTTLIIFATILNFNARANCGSFFGKFLKKTELSFEDTPEYKYRARQKKLENQANLFRTRKDNPDPALNLKIYEKIEKMNVFIFNNIHAPNERLWRTFFREFEADFISFDRINKILKKLPGNNFSKELLQDIINDQSLGLTTAYKEFLLRSYDQMGPQSLFSALTKERSQVLPRLGTHYQEYRMVRGNLEGLLKREDCDEICKKQVNMLLGRIGADSDKEKLINGIFFEGASRPDTAVMRELLYQEPEFVLTKLKGERNAEFFRFLKSFISQPEFIDTLFGYIYKNPRLKNNPRVNFLFREIYNSHARNSHFPKISKVIHAPDNPSQSMDLLQRLNTSVSKDELLVTFARRVDSIAETKWNKILEHAKQADPDFAKRMESAAEVAKKRGDMSPTDRRSFVGRLAAGIVVAVPTFSYFYFDIKPSELMEIIYSDDDDSSSVEVTEVTEEETSVEEMPEPDSGEPLMVDSEEDEIIEEAVEVILEATEESTRSPSSTQSDQSRPVFTRFWCSLFTCKESNR